MMNIRHFIFGLSVLICVHHGCSEIVNEDLILTLQEKEALDKFRFAIENIYFSDPYMRTDIYLIRWLRANSLNIEAAKNKFLKSLQWRQEYGIDGILDEDFSDMENEFPADLSAVDYAGRPVITADAGQWDVRKGVVTGKRVRLLRYVYKLMEKSFRLIQEFQRNNQSVTRSLVLLNLKGFNLIQHGCGQCIPIYLSFVTAYENYYPEMAYKIIGINTPASFDVVLRLVRPVMSKQTQDSLILFGYNEDEWSDYVLNLIPAHQIERQFGGNKIEAW